jgi:Pyridoxamine 5'-phosphate oxidase
MAEHRYGVVSSISATGTPQSALVGIAVTDQLEIIFDTLRSTRKYRNLIARPACSVVLGFPGEKTLQLEGNAMEPDGAERTRYQEAYFSAWPDGRDRIGWKGMTYLVVKPTWMRFSDFDKRPPLIEEITI